MLAYRHLDLEVIIGKGADLLCLGLVVLFLGFYLFLVFSENVLPECCLFYWPSWLVYLGGMITGCWIMGGGEAMGR